MQSQTVIHSAVTGYKLAAHRQASSAILYIVVYQAISVWLAISVTGDSVLLKWDLSAKATSEFLPPISSLVTVMGADI